VGTYGPSQKKQIRGLKKPGYHCCCCGISERANIVASMRHNQLSDLLIHKLADFRR
jgi:hypothetical protein